jgi:superfamily II DNA or RNA helicase
LASFRDLDIAEAYDSGSANSNVLKDFYLPIISASTNYDRLTGYFSSTILSLAARGIAGLVRNGGTMRLVASPEFSEEDMAVLGGDPSDEEVDEVVANKFHSLIGDVDGLAEYIARDHLRALAWMVREEYLQIRILVPRNLDGRAGIFHSKVGILSDGEGNKLSFSGSINETAAAWRHNIEEFKVFRSWEPEGSKWVSHDQQQFDRYWAPSEAVAYSSRPLPTRLREELISIAPADFESLNFEEDAPESDGFGSLPRLRQYQEDAIDAWVKGGMRGILEMATGTGKTRTALDCIRHFQRSVERSLTVVTAPYQHIAIQWRELLAPLDPFSTFDSGNWSDTFTNSLSELKTFQRDHLVWIAVQNTAASPKFLELVRQANISVDQSLFVGDEAHGLGARVFQQALSAGYSARLGLTATPRRWFDDAGSEVLQEFFGGTVFEFDISKALTWIDPETGETPLVPYEYHPEFVDLSEEELAEFVGLTAQIGVEAARNRDNQMSEKLELLLFKRAALVKTAVSKFDGLQSLLDRTPDLAGTLIYCHSETQMSEVIRIVDKTRYRYRKFTGQEGATPKSEYKGLSEREWILKDFAEGDVGILIAMKCLDEGVDIPSARRGIILASSGNPREFIQRRGRLLRRFPGKDRAVIHDFVVAPSFSDAVAHDVREVAGSIVSKELSRIEEFSRDAMNSEIITTMVLKKLTELGFE